MEKVGHEEQFFYAGEQRVPGFYHAVHLEKGIQLHELHTGQLIDLFPADTPEKFFHHSLGAGIPVANRIFQHHIPLSNKTIVHTPRIHTHSFKIPETGFCCLSETLFQFMIQAEQIPVIVIEELDLMIGEAMQDFEFQCIAEPAKHCTPAACPEIKGQKKGRSHSIPFNYLFSVYRKAGRNYCKPCNLHPVHPEHRMRPMRRV